MTEAKPFPADFLNRTGLNRQHVFDLADLPAEMLGQIAPHAGERQLILLGHAGRQLWECVKAAGLTSADPIDDYTAATVARWFSECLPGRRYRLLYPGPLAVGLQALGKLAGWHQPSPLMVGVDAQWGSWFAYRALIVTDTGFLPFFAVDRSNPCTGCLDKPCIGACPAGALSAEGMDLARCVSYRRQPDSPCRHSCLARLACPVGSKHRYDAEQLRHSYSRSLQMIADWPALLKPPPAAR